MALYGDKRWLLSFFYFPLQKHKSLFSLLFFYFCVLFLLSCFFCFFSSLLFCHSLWLFVSFFLSLSLFSVSFFSFPLLLYVFSQFSCPLFFVCFSPLKIFLLRSSLSLGIYKGEGGELLPLLSSHGTGVGCLGCH